MTVGRNGFPLACEKQPARGAREVRSVRAKRPVGDPTDGPREVRSLVAPRQSVVTEPTDGRFSCSGKRYCRQMSSCAEAHFYLRQCGVASLDGNSDGEPCEMLCGTAH